MTYGVRITPDDNGKSIILDGGARYISYLASVSMNGIDRSRAVKTMPSGATALIVPRRLVSIFPSTTQVPQFYYITGMSLSGGTFAYSVNSGAENVVNEIGYCDVFSVAGAAAPGGYGIRIVNGANFLEVSDTSYLGYVTWRGTVDINTYWQIPDAVLSLGTYVVFARWNNTDTPLYLNRDNNRIECYNAFASASGSAVGGSISGVQICIVSCGFSPALPASGYGLVIRNASGVITYSSRYPPVMWRDCGYNFSGYSNFDTSTGEVLSWTNPTGNVSLPMIPLCSIGLQRGDFGRNASSYSFRQVLYSGFKMSGNSVSSARAKAAGSDAPVSMFVKAMQVPCYLPCLDAADYF